MQSDFFRKFLQNDPLFYAVLLTLVASTAFALGQISTLSHHTAAKGEVVLVSEPTTPSAPGGLVDGVNAAFVASKNGTKYHRLDCPGAKQIADHNKLFFATIGEAMSAGYSKAANCN